MPGIVDEIRDVLRRPQILRVRGKRNFTPPPMDDFLGIARMVKAVPVASPELRDPKDMMVLGCAVVAGADCIVTGDGDLLALGKHGSIEILTPAAALARISG